MRPIVIVTFAIPIVFVVSLTPASAQSDGVNGWRELVHVTPSAAGDGTLVEQVGDLLPQATTHGCTPTTTALRFDGGYEVSMCYRTPDGNVGEAKSGVWASAESGILWFFNRDNAEVLVKVLNGCSHNGYRWVFVAPVTDLEFNLWVTAPNGSRWVHSNRLGVTAATRSDTRAFSCANEGDGDPDDDDDDDGGRRSPDLVVSNVSVSDSNPVVDEQVTLHATVGNFGNGSASATAIRYFASRDAQITVSDHLIASDVVAALPASATSVKTMFLVFPGTDEWYVGACVDPVPGESNTTNNCSSGVYVVASAAPLTGTWTGTATNTRIPEVASVRATMSQGGSSFSGTISYTYSSLGTFSGSVRGTVSGSAVSFRVYPDNPSVCAQVGEATVSGSSLRGTWTAVSCSAPESGSFNLTRSN